jgi:predicted DNA-binding WGR domain protein
MPRREFLLSDGSSKKFWAIDLDGKKFTVQFGRIGTAGQTQVKEFDSADEAEKAANKLIAEKTKKGYAETGATTPAPAPAPAATKPATKRKTKAAAESPPAEPAPAETPAAPPAETAVTRRIDLDPADWFYATWRDLPPLPRPAAPPYDPDECARRFTKISPTGRIYTWGYAFHWDRAEISPSLTPEEARFWFAAMIPAGVQSGFSPGGQDLKPKELALHLARQDFSRGPTGAEMLAKLRGVGYVVPAEVVIPLANLLTHQQLAELLVDPTLDSGNRQAGPALVAGVRKYVVPYLTKLERASLCGAVRNNLPPATSAPTPNYSFPSTVHFAAMLGMHDEVLARIAPPAGQQIHAVQLHVALDIRRAFCPQRRVRPRQRGARRFPHAPARPEAVLGEHHPRLAGEHRIRRPRPDPRRNRRPVHQRGVRHAAQGVLSGERAGGRAVHAGAAPRLQVARPRPRLARRPPRQRRRRPHPRRRRPRQIG